MPDVGDAKWHEGIALLYKEHLKKYIAEAPPDDRSMGIVTVCYQRYSS
jgi:hypothetical protein